MKNKILAVFIIILLVAIANDKKKVILHESSSPSAKQGIAYAKAQLGKPYLYGATGPDSFDCSGLVMRAYGLSLRTSEQQWAGLRHTSHPSPGDLVFFVGGDTSLDPSPGHVGIYLSPHKMIDAYGANTYVRIESFGKADSAPGLMLVGYAVP